MEEIWKDPVWSKVIATSIIFLLSQLFVFIWGIIKNVGFIETYKNIFKNIKKKLTTNKQNNKKQNIIKENDKELEIYEAPTVFFHYRFCDAFPDLEYGYQWLNSRKDINNRLKILLAPPTIFKKAKGYGVITDPIWWFRDSSALPIEKFKILNKKKVLINIDELIIEKIAAYKGRSYYEDFVYIQCLADKPTGLYEYNKEFIETLNKNNEVYKEEYGIYKKHFVTRQEYDNGSAIIKGKPKKINGAELRSRLLTKYNFIIAAKFSPYNSHKFNHYSNEYFNKLLKEEISFDEFVNWMRTLPKNHNDE